MSHNVAPKNEALSTNFVMPRFIEGLGCEGLSHYDIAQSIGMRPDNLHMLIRKLVRSKDVTEFQETSESIDKINKRKVFYVSTIEAKFIVTQSSTRAGMDYCKWLVRMEEAVMSHRMPSVKDIVEAVIQALDARNPTEKKETARQVKNIDRKPKEAFRPVQMSQPTVRVRNFSPEHFDVREAKRRFPSLASIPVNNSVLGMMARKVSQEQGKPYRDFGAKQAAEYHEAVWEYIGKNARRLFF